MVDTIGFQSADYSTYLEHCPTATSTPDLDFYQVSVSVEPAHFFLKENFLELWTSLGGEMLTLSSSSRRRTGTDREIPEDHLILSYHPVMVSTVNRLGLKELIVNCLSTQGYPSVASDTTRTLVRGTRPVPTSVFRDTLRRCLVKDVTFTNYGMKIPLQQSTIFKMSSYLSSSRPSPGYPMNSYDISYTCRSSTLLNIRLRHDPLITRFILFSPMDFRPHPSFNHGGTCKRVLNPNPDRRTSSLVSISTYSPLYHHVNQAGNLNPPMTVATGRKRLEHYDFLYRLFLNTDDHHLGGLRHEVRVQATSPQDALALVQTHKPWLISSLQPDIFSLSIPDYKILLPQILDAAKEELYSLGFSFSHRPPAPGQTSTITAAMQLIFGDLRRLFGRTTVPRYATDPIDPDTWWRRRVQLPLPEVYIPPIILVNPFPAPAPAPALLPPVDDADFHNFLEQCVRTSLRRNRIRWAIAHQLISVRYPGLSLDPLKNRVNYLRRRALI